MTTPHGRPSFWAAATVLVAAAVLLGGCSSGDDDAAVVEPGASSATAVDTDLTIVVDHGNSKVDNWSLSCPAGGTPSGTHPDPAKACAVLAAKGGTALDPPPTDGVCTEIYGGPDIAKITGTYLGKPILASFTLQNGCAISRWNEMKGLLPAGGTALDITPTEQAPGAGDSSVQPYPGTTPS